MNTSAKIKLELTPEQCDYVEDNLIYSKELLKLWIIETFASKYHILSFHAGSDIHTSGLDKQMMYLIVVPKTEDEIFGDQMMAFIERL